MKLPSFLSRFFPTSSSQSKADAPDSSNTTEQNAEEISSNTQEWISQVVEETYSELAVFVRDMNLPENLAEKYTDGLIIQEAGMVDASLRIGGMVTTHRFAILSNHMKSLGAFDFGNRGLCVAMVGSHFKVMGTHRYKDKTFILLLHLPDGDAWKLFQHIRVNIEEDIKMQCIQQLEEKCGEPAIPELAEEEWLERCAHPVGMNDQGELFPLE